MLLLLLMVNHKLLSLKTVKATVTIENLTAEDYKIEATYNGDAKYLTSSAVYTFNVNKLPSSITVSADDIKVGEDAVIVASVTSELLLVMLLSLLVIRLKLLRLKMVKLL